MPQHTTCLRHLRSEYRCCASKVSSDCAWRLRRGFGLFTYHPRSPYISVVDQISPAIVDMACPSDIRARGAPIIPRLLPTRNRQCVAETSNQNNSVDSQVQQENYLSSDTFTDSPCSLSANSCVFIAHRIIDSHFKSRTKMPGLIATGIL